MEEVKQEVSAAPGKLIEVTSDEVRLNQINMQFSQLCAEAGQLQFEIALKKNQLMELNQKINALNGEAYALNQSKGA